MPGLVLTGKRRCVPNRLKGTENTRYLRPKFESGGLGGTSLRDSTGIIPGNHRGCSREAVSFILNGIALSTQRLRSRACILNVDGVQQMNPAIRHIHKRTM